MRRINHANKSAVGKNCTRHPVGDPDLDSLRKTVFSRGLCDKEVN